MVPRSYYTLVFILSVLSCKAKGCTRGPRALLAQERSAQDIIQSWKNDFDINVHFGLRKIGLGSGGAGSGNATKCYGNLGCLQITDEWYGITRPVNVLPVERYIINTRFLLTTRESLQQPRFLNLSQPLTVSSSPFDGTRPTKIIIHGFIDTGFVPWISVRKYCGIAFHKKKVMTYGV